MTDGPAVPHYFKSSNEGWKSCAGGANPCLILLGKATPCGQSAVKLKSGRGLILAAVDGIDLQANKRLQLKVLFLSEGSRAEGARRIPATMRTAFPVDDEDPFLPKT
jgi:hypothetical protein